MKNIDYKKLKKYEIGKPSSLGYELNFSNVPNGSYVLQGASFDDATKQYTQQLTPISINGGLNIATNAANMLRQVWSTNPIITRHAANIANAKTLGTLAGNGNTIAQTLSDGAIKEGGTRLSDAVTASGGNAVHASAGFAPTFNPLALATGIANTVQSGLLVGTDVSNFKQKIDSLDIFNTAPRYYNQRRGFGYNAYGNVDQSGIMKYVNAQNEANKKSLIWDSATTGMNALGTIGSILGPVGYGIGGFFGGAIGAAIGRNKADDLAYDRTYDTIKKIQTLREVMPNYNWQNESEAGSQALRAQNGYDGGKNAMYTSGKEGDITTVHTSHGIVPGIMMGLAGKGESIYNPEDGTASVFDEGQKRVDNIKTGVPLPGYNEGKNSQSWDRTVIFGNKINPLTGNSFADDAKPYSKVLEKLDKEDKMTNLSKHTKEVNRKNAMNSLNKLALVQAMQSYNCGKNAKYDNGWVGDYASVVVPRLLLYGTVLKARTPMDKTVRNTYSGSTATPYLHQLMNLQDDPSQDIQNMRDARSRAMYAATHQGGLTGAQAGLISSLGNIESQRAINDIKSANRRTNLGYRQAGLQAAANAAMQNDQRMDAANVRYNEDTKEANQVQFARDQAFYNSMYNLFGALGGDINAMRQYRQSVNYQNKLLGLYDQKIKNDSKR